MPPEEIGRQNLIFSNQIEQIQTWYLFELLCFNTKEISNYVDDVCVLVSEDCIVVMIIRSIVNLDKNKTFILNDEILKA